MKRPFLWICLAFAGALSSTLHSAGAASTKTVFVSVAASAAGPVEGLSAADVKVQENGKPVEVTAVAPASFPLSIALLFDTSYPIGRTPPTQDVRRAATAFVSTIRAAAPDAEFRLYAVSNAAIPLCDFTADPVRIRDAITHIVVGAQSASPMLEGVVDASQQLEKKPAPRRAIVAVSLGSAEGGGEHSSNIAKELLQSGATLWTISVAGTSDAAPSATRDEVWTRLTAASGGMGIGVVQATGLENQLKMIANTLLSQYSVTFARKEEGAVKPLTGQTAKGAKILFSHFVR